MALNGTAPRGAQSERPSPNTCPMSRKVAQPLAVKSGGRCRKGVDPVLDGYPKRWRSFWGGIMTNLRWSLKASSSTNWLGFSTLLAHSKKTLPGSARVAAVKGATRASHWSATSGRMENLTTMKSIVAPCTSSVASSLAPRCPRRLVRGWRALGVASGRRASRETARGVSYLHDGHESMRRRSSNSRGLPQASHHAALPSGIA